MGDDSTRGTDCANVFGASTEEPCASADGASIGEARAAGTMTTTTMDGVDGTSDEVPLAFVDMRCADADGTSLPGVSEDGLC